MTTIAVALADAKPRIAAASSSASLDAQLLLAEVLCVGRASVIAHPERVLTTAQAAQYEAWVTRRAAGEPIAYLLGRKPFYDREMIVTPDVLVPRPETEHLLEAALDAIPIEASITAVDVGTGSGAIAVTFAALRPRATVYGVDVSPAALGVAARNVTAQNVSVELLQSDLLSALVEQGITVDLLLANLPYIVTDEMHRLAVSQHEPHLALDGGADGLDLFRRMFAQVPVVCKSGAMLLLEIGADQGETVPTLAQQMLNPAQISLTQDYAGLDRVVSIQL